MSNHPGVSKTLEWLNSLRGTVQDAAAREDKINADFRNGLTRHRQLRDRAMADAVEKLALDLSDAQAAHRAAAMNFEARLAARKLRLSRANDGSRRRAMADVDHWEGERKYRLQKDELHATRTRDGTIGAAEQNYAEIKAGLVEGQNALIHLEVRAAEAFSGYYAFGRMLVQPAPEAAPGPALDEPQMVREMQSLMTQADEGLRQFERRFLPRFFKYWPFWIIVALLPLTVPFLMRVGVQAYTLRNAGITVAWIFGVGLVFHLIGWVSSRSRARAVAGAVVRARRLAQLCADKNEARHAAELARAEAEFQELMQTVYGGWTEVGEAASKMRATRKEKVEVKVARAAVTFERHIKLRREAVEQEHIKILADVQAAGESQKRELERSAAEKESRLTAEHQAQWAALVDEWKTRLGQIHEAVTQANAGSEKLFLPWADSAWEEWKPPGSFAHVAKFGQLEVDVAGLVEAMPKDPRLALIGPAKFTVPLQLSFPREGAILFESKESGRSDTIGALNNIILRLLSVAPAGRLNFTIFDPVGLGENFAGVMHLSDYGEGLIDGRIWTQAQQIEQRLADLNDHMEKVIQMYLRNEYETIAQYNEKAGKIAEKYRFLVIADFPVNFSEIAIKRLLSIAQSGPRCGVYLFIHWDQRHALPANLLPDDLRKSCVSIARNGNRPTINGRFFTGVTLQLDAPPSTEFANEFIHKAGRASRDSNRVEVPFEQVAPSDAELWTEETTGELRVPIGRTGATKLQYLAIGKGTRQHALIAGKTGSGKSTLFHVIVTNLALWCSPEQVEFYLIDFKKGVEFKCYATKRLPHARVVAIESDREFGLSVLQRLDAELKRRGDMFRSLGVQDVAGYKRAGGTEPIPRTLLLIDEFQEFFVEDDRVAQGASMLLDRIVRQGRAFGIHVILGSQTLGGAYSMARTTLGQMVIRIALQCNEADAYLIMDDNNPAPRLLTRPGEGIYNDAAGASEGNSPFQCVWISDEERDRWLDKVSVQAGRSGKAYAPPIVFEGDAPADVAENPLLHDLLTAPALVPAAAARIWLGAPNSIKGPTEAVFQRQSGNNLLIVGQRDEAALAILSVGLIALAAQHPRDRARFYVFDSSPPESPQREYLSRMIRAIPHAITLVKHNELGEVLSGLGEEMKRRAEDERGAEQPAVYLIINGLQRFAKLRFEEEFGYSDDGGEANVKPGNQLNKLICDGTSLGFHTLITCDTYNNVNRSLSKKAFSEFEMRILFQMSANDSASLIDNPKAGNLGLHRALFYNEQEGHLEVFRPYALPGNDWIENAERELKRLLG